MRPTIEIQNKIENGKLLIEKCRRQNLELSRLKVEYYQKALEWVLEE